MIDRTDELIIQKKHLPLDNFELKTTKGFCDNLTKSGRLINLRDIPNQLRQDYLDETLFLPDRANYHFKIDPDLWRKALDYACQKAARIITSALGSNLYNTPIVLPWRAGLGYLKPFADCGVEKFVHFGIKRNEDEPHLTKEIYLDLDEEAIISRSNYVLITDIMLATGGSFKTIIKKLERLGVRQEEIILISLISAPEGIYSLIKRFPRLQLILTNTIDQCLNEFAYIKPGLGDAGNKFFDRLLIDYFKDYTRFFSYQQWQLLIKLIETANSRYLCKV